jgi:mannan endo-1,4-beta-mannosidase
MKKKIILLTTLILHITIAFGTEDKSFYTRDGKLFDATDSVFIIRGVNNPHIWFPEQSFSALDTIAGYRCNAVRIVWALNGEPEDLRAIIERVVELKMIAIPEIHDPTGSDDISDLEAAALYWVRDDVKSILNEFKPYIILNIANEWMAGGDADLWFTGYKSAISIIRNAGLHHCLLIDAAGWGQDLGPTKRHAGELLAHDPQSNLIFAVHMYGYWNDNEKIDTELNYFIDNKLTLVVGEFGYDYSSGENNLGCRVDAPFLLRKCDENGIGYLPWSWTGNNEQNQWLDMVSPNDWETLTPWGELVLCGEHGIYKTARTCSIFETVTLPENDPLRD